MSDEIFSLIDQEEKRQRETLMMIPSENYTSSDVRRAVGSVLMHKYAEGYPRARYYQGNSVVDQVEDLARERAKKLFGVPHVNVQSYSGSPANLAVYFALTQPGDTVIGFDLPSGGHLTHGASSSITGKWFKAINYGATADKRIDMEEVRTLALTHRPKLIWCGLTAYPWQIDFEKFSQIADEVGAYLIADISHIAGLIAGGVHPSPVPFAHAVTTTTHKTLRGPRGAMIMVTQKGLEKDPDLAAKIDKAVFPGLQGGPHMETIAGIAIALKEVDSDDFKEYAQQVVKNAKVLAQTLQDEGLKVIGTQNHLMLVDLSEHSGGYQVALALEKAGIVVNKNTIPGDVLPPFYPSGIRLGTPALTTRGMKQPELTKIAHWIAQVANEVSGQKVPTDEEARKVWRARFKENLEQNKVLKDINQEVKNLLSGFPFRE